MMTCLPKLIKPLTEAYISCDPGAKGFFCLLVPSHNYAEFISNIDKPSHILNMLHEWDEQYEIKAIILEDVHSLFGMSAKSNFGFGKNLGVVTTLAKLLNKRLTKLTPKIWQKIVGVTAKGKKIKQNVAELCAINYPTIDVYGPRGGLMDGKSDALMIAHAYYLTRTGGKNEHNIK